MGRWLKKTKLMLFSTQVEVGVELGNYNLRSPEIKKKIRKFSLNTAEYKKNKSESHYRSERKQFFCKK